MTDRDSASKNGTAGAGLAPPTRAASGWAPASVGGLTPPSEPSLDELRSEIEGLRRLVAERGHDLALLAETSREITATLDLDRVLRAVVNLAMRALPFDRGAVALYEHGQCDVRAVAGADAVDGADPAMRDLAARAAWAAGVGQSFYLSDRTTPASDAERIFLQIFGPDLEAADVGSGLYLPLRDEEGVVGVLLFEATRPDFADERQRELAAILANQATVAVRNAQLYSQVPLADVLGAFGARKRALLEVPRRRRLAVATLAVAIVGALTLVRWPLRVAGADPLFRPTHRAEVRALTPGVVERVLVREGAAVARGQPVAQLRDAELRAARAVVVASAEAAERDAALAASRGDAGEEQLQRGRAVTLRREAEVIDEQLGAMVLRSPVSGVVLTTRPEERLGAWLDEGDALVLVGRTDTLELEFGIDQRDIARVGVGDEVRLRVDALPQRTFSGHVASLGQVPSEIDGHVTFPVRAVVVNDGGLLRPGMAAHARVLTAPASAAGRLLRTPLRQARLLWWRIWS